MRPAATIVAALLPALGLLAAGASAQVPDPRLDPNYQPPPDSMAPAADPSAQPVHPATVGAPVNPDEPMVAPPPGWQLVRPLVIDGNLYYAVDDAEAYLAQAGLPYRPQVHRKEDTGFRFDLILVPRTRRDSAVYRQTVHSGAHVFLGTGGIRTSWGGGWWYWRDDFVFNTNGYAGPIDGQLSPGYAPPIPQPEPVVLTLEEQAGLSLGFGSAEEAIGLYRQVLEEDPEDARAVRALGVALLAAKRPEDGVATIRHAYRMDPGLAGEPLGAWIAGDSDRRMRGLIADTVRHGHRAGSASAWLAAAVLMQADGRPANALAMLERAAGLGLEADVERALRAELVRR